MQIRAAHPKDAEAITKLLTRSYPILMARSYDAELLAIELPAMTKANPQLLASGTYYVAEDGGSLIGCGGWTIEEPGSRQVQVGLCHLRHFATDPDRIRQGVGRAIFERCAVEAAEQGITRIQVFASFNAEPFYRSFGLARVAVINLPNGPKLPAVLMEGWVQNSKSVG